MGKEITLPWSCDTSEKIQSGLFWIILIGSPIMCVLGMMNYNGLETAVGLLGSIISWLFRLMAWAETDKFPHFKCKTKESS